MLHCHARKDYNFSVAHKNVIYRLTPAGREAWESQDSALPAEYRRILWLMDFHGHAGAMEDFLRQHPQSMVDDWLAEIHELGLIEPVPEGEGPPKGRDPDMTMTDPADVRRASESATESLSRAGSYLAMERIAKREPTRKAAGEIVVLIVEDDPDQLALADLRVSMAGYQVRAASSVRGFLETMLDSGAPDLLMLDVALPDGDGFEVLSKLRRHHVFGDLPIVMLTARNDAADIGRGLVLGADGYITKPYTKKIVADVIRRVLRQA